MITGTELTFFIPKDQSFHTATAATTTITALPMMLCVLSAIFHLIFLIFARHQTITLFEGFWVEGVWEGFIFENIEWIIAPQKLLHALLLCLCGF